MTAKKKPLTNREIAENVVAQWFLHEWVNQQPRPEEVGRDKLVELIEDALEQRVERLTRAGNKLSFWAAGFLTDDRPPAENVLEAIDLWNNTLAAEDELAAEQR